MDQSQPGAFLSIAMAPRINPCYRFLQGISHVMSAIESHKPDQELFDKLVKYRTAHYQMLGYVDVTGQWMASDGKEETLPVRAWREIAETVGWPERLS